MLEFFNNGGPFMYPLGLWSIMALAFFIERVWTYARIRSEDELAEITNDMTGRIDSGASFEQLKEMCVEVGKLEGDVYNEGIERFEHLSREQRSVEEMRVEMNGTVERAANGYLERYLSVIQFVANSVVLLGLLGTVNGMIRAFEGIAEKGLGEPTIVAAGISEALITTVTGLVIAVPSLAVYTYFTQRAESKSIQFEPYGHGFVDALLRRWSASKAA
ncbi:MAG: MotA/TolQ/ExbB proton channel family protein [Gemmatimonadetes bacterium]|jgi:biopolymer transport protein ExbB|nr:MotA/TolQ/ExbB proton channel family protein [Gemmatimonadota bacterium]MBT5058624.1 MotA/TolQ/ExbB proton channel family protein [Gemmatimonadota bacterium]MBT5144061.1 MotA/TolQ/ExbB proton channel family protein [Gemmatimonadota bacterium]MBT5590334.1 MotA/TolQ/ExbB proton channel family protein [Gemmatimonadota bacterium]MBT5964369.1 MotA/TolQ/ExbB proton channel family protein [Gemmatimonadota bacterium]